MEETWGVCNPRTQYGSQWQERRAPVTAGTGEKEQPFRDAWRTDAFLALSPHPISHSDGPGLLETVECRRSFIPPHPDSRTAAMSAPVNVRRLSVMAVPSPLDAVRFCRTPCSPLPPAGFCAGHSRIHRPVGHSHITVSAAARHRRSHPS